MLGIGHPDRHALPRITLSKTHQPCRALPPARAGSFIDPNEPFSLRAGNGSSCPNADLPRRQESSTVLIGRRSANIRPAQLFPAACAHPLAGPSLWAMAGTLPETTGDASRQPRSTSLLPEHIRVVGRMTRPPEQRPVHDTGVIIPQGAPANVPSSRLSGNGATLTSKPSGIRQMSD